MNEIKANQNPEYLSAAERLLKIKEAYLSACLAELEALKPGNVHIFADGHGMTVAHFINSAQASSLFIAKPSLTVGERILYAVRATQSAVGLNTNLGIILLCAPLIHAAIHRNQELESTHQSYQQSLAFTLKALTIEDAQLTAQAIVLANPAGLGVARAHDVNQSVNVTLLDMMSCAPKEDYIALQYTNAFSDILEFGVMQYEKAMTHWRALANNSRQHQAWATTALYLSFLAHYLDSHIIRKHGVTVARQVMREAVDINNLFWQAENPKLVQKHLIAWDISLKNRGVNPGTSADLTVSCLLAMRICQL